MLRFRQSAFKHGFTEKDAEDVLDNELSHFRDGYSLAGNDLVVFLGENEDGILLEVKIEYENDSDDEWVFHIMRARKANIVRAGIKYG